MVLNLLTIKQYFVAILVPSREPFTPVSVLNGRYSAFLSHPGFHMGLIRTWVTNEANKYTYKCSDNR